MGRLDQTERTGLTVPKRNIPRLLDVAAGSGAWQLKLVWDNGLRSSVDVSDQIQSLRIYQPLRDTPGLFRSVRLGEFGTDITWPGGLDMSADLLLRLSREQAGTTMSAEAFRSWRETCGLTLDGAAEALGISRRMIAYYENGAKPVPRVVALATRGLKQAS